MCQLQRECSRFFVSIRIFCVLYPRNPIGRKQYRVAVDIQCMLCSGHSHIQLSPFLVSCRCISSQHHINIVKLPAFGLVDRGHKYRFAVIPVKVLIIGFTDELLKIGAVFCRVCRFKILYQVAADLQTRASGENGKKLFFRGIPQIIGYDRRLQGKIDFFKEEANFRQIIEPEPIQ